VVRPIILAATTRVGEEDRSASPRVRLGVRTTRAG
jgi:hypothetical protein